jgi:putative ATP-dependent endonuclease of the OLD family
MVSRKGRDEGDEQDRKQLYAADRAALGLSRLDIVSDAHFTWARNTILTRLSADSEPDLGAVLASLGRGMRQSDISSHQSILDCQSVADTIKAESQNTGVKPVALSPKIDVQRQSMSAGVVSLHEENVPLRNKGSGSKRLIGAAMQMKLHGGKNISLIDEIELGLEPHRIRGLIYKLKKSRQQIFATTHSPVVIRELSAIEEELYVCKRDAAGIVSLDSFGSVPDIQRKARSNAEAFLGTKIVACEGLTEIGCIRAYDTYRFDENNPPVWSLATSYFDCGGAGQIKSVCPKLIRSLTNSALTSDQLINGSAAKPKIPWRSSPRTRHGRSNLRSAMTRCMEAVQSWYSSMITPS